MKKALTLMFVFASLAVPASAGEMTDAFGGKLDEISAKQDAIMAKLDALATELNIVKIRATK
jgi:hypothetical protein